MDEAGEEGKAGSHGPLDVWGFVSFSVELEGGAITGWGGEWIGPV